jgi:hypothetical protein
MNNKKACVIALYLYQFHPTNNEWKFLSFTELYSVANAKPLQ